MKLTLLNKIPIIKKPQYLGGIVLLVISSLSFSANAANVVINKAVAEKIEAAAITIKGQVTDANDGTSLPGVSVAVKGTTIGVISDANGNFTINADENATLVFTYVGYETVEVPVAGKTEISVKLKPASKALEEVVVIGYGTAKKVSLTGAVDRVSGSKAVDGRPVTSAIQALQGESPNLIIQQRGWSPNGGTFNVNIRGTGTTGNNDPLVVIDGIIGGDLNTLNPSDIDNISVLKDAGSAAIYGSRSANGVLLVTTKKGRSGKPVITYNGIYGSQVPDFTFKPVDAYTNALYKNMSLVNSNRPEAYDAAALAAIKAKGNGDWRLETIMHAAPQTNQNFSVSGGGEKSTYLMSFGYFNQRSYLEKSDLNGTYGLRRFNFRLNQSATLGNFNTSWNLTYAKIQYNEPWNDVVGDVLRAPLTDSFQDSNGNYITGFVKSNPLALLRKGGFKYTNNDEINGAFNVSYNITPEFKIRGVFGGTVKSNAQFQRGVQVNYYPTGNSNNDRRVINIDSKSLATNTNLIAEYTKSFGKNDLNILVGVANESFLSEGIGVNKFLTDPTLGIPLNSQIQPSDRDATNGTYTSNQRTNETSLNSVFGRASYSYNNRYYIDATLRADASSNFPKSERWGYFPSIGGSWRISEEGFMSNYKDKVGDLRIRANYGVLGNQNVNAYQFLTRYLFNENAYAFNNQPVATTTVNLANPGITWEKAATFDVGADATFFNGKLTVGADYFNKVTSDILAPRQDVPTVFGSGFPFYNVSKVQNRGWELKVTYATRGVDLAQNFSFSISDAVSKLLQFSYGQTENVFQREEFEFVRRVGEPITVYQGYKTNGFYQSAAEVASYPRFADFATGLAPGDWKFVDKDGNGVIDKNDKFVLGNPFPRYTFGFSYNASYKGFDASLLIQGVLKRDAAIRGELIEPYHFSDYGGTIYDVNEDFWRPDNTDAKFPRVAENGSVSNKNNYRTGSDMYIFNAAYARLKNIQVGYTLPNKFTNKAGISKVRVYFTAQNVITISPLKFTDPEGSEFGNNLDNTVGANSPRGYPVPVFYGAGLDITF